MADIVKDIRHRTKVIRNTFKNTGTIDEADLEFLIKSTIHDKIISDIAERDWISLKALQLTSEVEIEELKRQLKEALGN